jgi:hypothetical protein
MAVPSNTRVTYGAIGIREDLSNIIYNISPTETPFLSGCGRETADNTYFEWQTDALTAAAANRATEGDDPASTAVSEPTRVGNYTQISVKAVQTSGTAEAVDFAGRKSSQAYQLAKRAKEMKRDMEKMLMDNVAQSAGAGPSPGPATARATGGLGSWVATNYHTLGGAPSPPGLGSASAGTGTNTASDATSTGTLTEAGMKTVIKECFDSGGTPDTILVGSANKQVISALTQTVSSLRTDANRQAPAHVVASVDVYVSDFGSFKIIPDRFQRARDCWFIDFDFWAVAYLRPFQTESLAKTGDSIKQMIIAEYGLMSKNQAANGFLADV